MIPLGLLRIGPQKQTGIFSWLSHPIWLAGGAILLWCFQDFVQKGKGTPAPIDPPKELVVSGLYRYVRNPMYVGVLMMIAGHFLWFGLWAQLVYAGFIFTAFHLFVLGYEERHLRKTFGTVHEDYMRRVPRWLPRIK